MPVVATWSPFDATLDVLVPLGLATVAPTCIVVDLDPDGSTPGTGAPLAELVSEGPTRRQLDPVEGASAYLANGGIEPADAEHVVAELVRRWPFTVLKCPRSSEPPTDAVALVPLLPEPYLQRVRPPMLYQRGGFSSLRHPPGPTLPRPRRSTVAALLDGRKPVHRDRWLRALSRVWVR